MGFQTFTWLLMTWPCQKLMPSMFTTSATISPLKWRKVTRCPPKPWRCYGCRTKAEKCSLMQFLAPMSEWFECYICWDFLGNNPKQSSWRSQIIREGALWRRLQGKVQSSARTGTVSQVELAHRRLFHASTGDTEYQGEELAGWSKLSRRPWPLDISVHLHRQECLLSVEESLPIIVTFLGANPRYPPSNTNLLMKKKNKILPFATSMKRHSGYYAKWNKSVKERQIP